MSEIETLTLRAQSITQSVDRWNAAMVLALVFAALAAVAVVATTRLALTRAKQLAEVQARIAEIKEGDLKARADNLQKGLAQSKKETAALEKIAEDERLARVALEERLAWRRITPKERDKIVLALKPYAGSVVQVVGMGNGDLESETFAKDIAAVLHAANWSLPPPDFSNTMIPAPLGLDCRVDKREDAGKALAEVLGKLPTAVVRNVPFAGGMVASIRVGLRPPP